MARIETIQPKIDRGRGKAGLLLGQSWDVYRLNSKSTGQLVQPSNLVLSQFRAQFERIEARSEMEINMIVKVPVFRALCDASRLQIGDVLVASSNQYRSDQSAFTFAYYRPLRAYVFMFTPIPLTITRTENNPTKTDTGRVPYAGMAKRFEQILVLNNGNYSFSATGTPTTVYAGLQATSKRGELPTPDQRLPTDVKRQTWDVYHGLLPGVQLMESDIINAANGDRYYIATPFFQYSGLQGAFHICEKLRV